MHREHAPMAAVAGSSSRRRRVVVNARPGHGTKCDDRSYHHGRDVPSGD
jgi:hypothetical protein